MEGDESNLPSLPTSTGFKLHWHPGAGGFYLSKGEEGSLYSVNKPPVALQTSDDAFKVEETEDSGSDSEAGKGEDKVEETKDSGSDSEAVKGEDTKDPGSDSDALKVDETQDFNSDSDALKVDETKDSGSYSDVLKVEETKDSDVLKVEEIKDSSSGFDVLKVEETKDSCSDSDALKVEEIKDSCSDSDVLRVEETKDCGSDSNALKVEEIKKSGSDSNAMKLEETQDSNSVSNAFNVEETQDSVSESSMSSVNKPAVNDDVLKLEQANEVLLEKVANLEAEVTNLKQKVESLTAENKELEEEIEDNIRDIQVYMSWSKLEIQSLEDQLDVSKEFAKKIDVHMCNMVSEKLKDTAKHDSEILELKNMMIEYQIEIAQLKTKDEKKEKIRNGVIDKLKDDLKEKSELLDEVSKNMEALILDKSSQNSLIHKLKTELEEVRFENAREISSFDNVEKLTDELKLKVVELESEVEKQMLAILD